jgi:hypothetical protein
LAVLFLLTTRRIPVEITLKIELAIINQWIHSVEEARLSKKTVEIFLEPLSLNILDNLQPGVSTVDVHLNAVARQKLPTPILEIWPIIQPAKTKVQEFLKEEVAKWQLISTISIYLVQLMTLRLWCASLQLPHHRLVSQVNISEKTSWQERMWRDLTLKVKNALSFNLTESLMKCLMTTPMEMTSRTLLILPINFTKRL